MKRLLTPTFLAVFLVGCGGPRPDPSLVLYEQPHPELAALAHTRERPGLSYHYIKGTSMQPFLYEEDWVVRERIPYDEIKAGTPCFFVTFGVLRLHVASKKLGDEWIMDGINARRYENKPGERMTRDNYQGIMVKGYTKRKKP